MSTPHNTSRLVGLDALRAVAVLLVLGRHVLTPDHQLTPWLGTLVRGWRSVGWMGVDLFFVLSGFLVSGLLFNEYRVHGNLKVLRFLGRRGFKIYPSFYVLLAGTWVLFRDRFLLTQFLSEALFVQNYFGMVWNHTWSLAVEEHFYVGLAGTLWIYARKSSGPDPFVGLPRMCLLVMGLVLALRVRAFLLHPVGHLLLPTHYRIDALLFGTLLAYAWAFRPAFAAWVSKHLRAIVIASLLLLLPCLLLPLKNNLVVNTIGLTTNYLGFGGIVIAVVSIEDGGSIAVWLRGRLVLAMARVGGFSYSIYVWHMAVNHICAHYLPERIGASWTLAAYLVGSVVVGIAMMKLVELPFLALRGRIFPARPIPKAFAS